MRLSKPRIPPLPDAEWYDEQRELLTRGRSDVKVLNVFGTQILFKSTLPPRERELLILRIGHLCNAKYEFHHHVAIGKQAGLTDEDIQSIQHGPASPHWTEFDRLL